MSIEGSLSDEGVGAGRRELRLAVVMNGGVSLAVWMGGVAHELDLLRRASCDTPPPAGLPAGERALFDEWRALCRARNVEVVVDVLAGTSAGGLNGALLAMAIARGAPLSGLRSVWLDDGSLERGKLLPRSGTAGVPSLLDGDFFAGAVTQALDGLPADREGKDVRPVTLFVTGTALATPDRELQDSFGQPFTMADHRTLYRFGRREGIRYDGADGGAPRFSPDPEDHFAATGPDAPLALAARASAGFPLAFAPVRENPALVERRWRPSGAPPAWLVDGGILDNAPFGPVLDAVARRPVTGPWRRVVCYVVPSSGDARRGPDPGGKGRPAWTAVAAGALELPREADFRGDVEQLTGLLAAAGGADDQALFDRLVGDEALGRSSWEAAERLFPLYRQARAVAGITEAWHLFAEIASKGYVVPPTGVDADEVLAGDPSWVPPRLSEGAAPWTWGVSAAERAVRSMLRNLRADLEERPDLRPAAADLSAAVDKVAAVHDRCHEDLRARFTELAGPGGYPYAVAPDDVAGWINKITEALRLPGVLGGLVAQAAEVFAAARGLPESRVVRDALVVEVLTRTFAGDEPFRRTPSFELLRLGPDVDSPLFAGMRPVGADKLYGTRLMHFGAFGRRDWRAWDWTWGRLDAVAHVTTLLGGEDAKDAAARLQRLVLAGESTTEERVRGGLARVSGMSGAELAAELRRDEAGRRGIATLAETALRFLWGTGEDGERPPAAVRRAGTMVNAALARRYPGRLGLRTALIRLAALPRRRALWRQLGPPAP